MTEHLKVPITPKRYLKPDSTTIYLQNIGRCSTFSTGQIVFLKLALDNIRIGIFVTFLLGVGCLIKTKWKTQEPNKDFICYRERSNPIHSWNYHWHENLYLFCTCICTATIEKCWLNIENSRSTIGNSFTMKENSCLTIENSSTTIENSSTTLETAGQP